jgi:carbamoyltransferase
MTRAPIVYLDDRAGRRWRVKLPSTKYERVENIERKVAELLTEGKIVGFYHGRSEFGPRALGKRSILADPRSPETQRILNEKVKHRQWFRPFAPAVLEEHCSEYFDLTEPSPHMLLVAAVHEDKKNKIPAITHVDGTARVQTVPKGTDPYRRVIEYFFEMTGIPMVLNTSFNDHGEPIVESPLDAYQCFTWTFMDALAMGPFLVTKVSADE